MFKEKFVYMQASEEDAAASVTAPGQEAFKTPDVSKPADVSDVSAKEQFGQDIDWDEVVDEGGNEPIEEEDASKAVEPSEDTQKAESEEKDPEVVDEETPPADASISDEDAAAAVSEEQDDFQPGAIEDMVVTGTSEDKGWEEEYRTSREGAMKELEGKYALSEDEADLFLTKPQDVVPQMAARIYVDVFESVLGAVNQMLPVKVGEISAVTNQAAEYTRQFYDAWPDLKTEEGHTKVNAIAKVYRELNPSATPEEFLRDVGTQASVALQLPIPGVTDKVVEPPADSGNKPFAPSGPAGAGDVVIKDPNQSENQFERLHAEWEDDDET